MLGNDHSEIQAAFTGLLANPEAAEVEQASAQRHEQVAEEGVDADRGARDADRRLRRDPQPHGQVVAGEGDGGQ